MCQYNYYDNFNGRDLLYCQLTKDICSFSRWCNKENKAIENGSDRCKMAKTKIVPKGAYEILFKKVKNDKEYLYIQYEATSIKVLNTLEEVGDYVYVKELNGTYLISTKPIKVTRTRKRKSEEDEEKTN